MKNLPKHHQAMPLTDVYETADAYTLKLEMPGTEKEQLSVTLEDNELEISTTGSTEEKSNESKTYREFALEGYYRKFRLGNDIDRNSINAGLENGILTVTLNKAEEVKPKKIAITTH